MPDQSDKPKADDTQREAEEKSKTIEERVPDEGGPRGPSDVLLPGSPGALMPGAGVGLGGPGVAGRSEGEQVLAQEGKAARSDPKGD